MEGQSRLTSVHPETPDETLAVSDSERRHNLVIPLTGFSRNVFVLARKELALHRDKLRTSSPAEGRDCAEACICTAELALSLPNGRSVEIEIDTTATAEGSGQPGCGPATQGGKGPFPDGNSLNRFNWK